LKQLIAAIGAALAYTNDIGQAKTLEAGLSCWWTWSGSPCESGLRD